MFFRLLIFIPMCASLVLAQEVPPKESPLEVAATRAEIVPVVRKIDATCYQIGGVTFDEAKREIRFAARVNMNDGLLEFIIVHQHGKVHESLLVTDISPTHLNLAFALLRYPPSRELYSLPNKVRGEPDQFPKVPEQVKAGARVAIDVEWTEGGKLCRLPINQWIQHGEASSMPDAPWVYGASESYEGRYIPETSGDIAAIFLASSAILNYPGEDNRKDRVWTPFPKRVPAQGTPVTVIIAPYQKSKSIPKP
jgi:hypothetical protein